MNILAPHPWDSVAYAGICILSLAMAVIIPGFIQSHCEWVYATTGISGACGLGAGWILLTLAFLAIAAYAGMQLYGSWKERQAE
jgi:hypothetical protein